MTHAHTSLINLPEEITIRILEHVADPHNRWLAKDSVLRPNTVDHEQLKTIQSVRLTCRALCRLTTPMLFPVLRVSLNSKSIDAFEQLSKSPLIAAYARGVVVDLKMYTSLAFDMALFEFKRQEHLRELLSRLESQIEARGDQEDENRNEYRRMEGILAALKEDWYRAKVGDDTSDSDSSMAGENASNTDSSSNAADDQEETAPLGTGEFESILLSAYPEYAKRYYEQDACINDNLVMARLAAACSRLSCGCKLVFAAEAERRFRDLTISDVLDDKETLSWMMVQPHAWEDIHCEDGNCDLTAARVLSRLPVALSDAGVQLTELHVGCFPHYACNGFNNLLLREEQQPAELEMELRQAFRHLDIFSFGELSMGQQWRRSNPPDADLPLLHAYLSAAMASPQLQSLHLSCYAYRVCTGRQGQREEQFRLRQVLLSCSNVSSLTSATILEMEVPYGELQHFLSQLGHGLRSLTLCNVKLADGSWAPLLDVLREAIVQRCQDRQCELLLSGLYGGEFGDYLLGEADGENYDAPSDSIPKQQLVKQASAYVLGETEINPLLADGAPHYKRQKKAN